MDQMNYSEFVLYIREHLTDYLEDIEVEEIKVINSIKNNSVHKNELCIKTAGNPYGTIIALDSFYQRYLAGSQTETLLEEISDIYFGNMILPGVYDHTVFRHFEQVRDNIYMCAINYESNKEMLRFCPYVKKLDLALVFRIRLKNYDNGIMSMPVTSDVYESWGISMDYLYLTAMTNTMRIFPAHIDRFNSGEATAEYMRFFVSTNEVKINGAVSVFMPGVLKKFAEHMDKDLFVLPSSVHEMLLLPKDSDLNAEDLKKIVSYVNDTVVSREEILSGHVYQYERESNCLSIAA